MNNVSYVCKYGLYHDKPCAVEGYDTNIRLGNYPTAIYAPSSNNGWIYTAYAKALGMPVDFALVHKTYLKCKEVEDKNFLAVRLPGKEEPPISRDEAIGMHYLGKDIGLRLMLFWDWNLSNSELWESYSWLKSFKTTLSLRDKHRNYIWENKVYPAYRFGFLIGYHDRYYIKKTTGNKSTLLEFVWFYMYVITTFFSKKHYVKNVLWLQLSHVKSKFWIMFLRRKNNFISEFGLSHPFNKGGLK